MGVNLNSEIQRSIITRLSGGIDIPPVLEESVQRHHKNLLKLAYNLESAGLSFEQIETSINTLVKSYRLELISAIHALMENTHE